LKENFRSLEVTLSSSSTFDVDELFSALLVVVIVEETTGTNGWFLIISIINLLSYLDLEEMQLPINLKLCQHPVLFGVKIFITF
jgi:hypothetical protein